MLDDDYWSITTISWGISRQFPKSLYFTELMEQFFQGIYVTVLAQYNDGYYRMIKTIEVAQSLNITSSPLKDVLLPNDRTGLCHHLANEDRICWVSND